MDDPRNTDNAWIETVAVSIHFQDQSNMELKRLNSVCGLGFRLGTSVLQRDPGACREVSEGFPSLGPDLARTREGGCGV